MLAYARERRCHCAVLLLLMLLRVAGADDVFVTMDAMHLKWNQRLTTAVVQAPAFNRMGFLRAERSE